MGTSYQHSVLSNALMGRGIPSKDDRAATEFTHD